METLESLDPGLIEIDAADKVEMAGEQVWALSSSARRTETLQVLGC